MARHGTLPVHGAVYLEKVTRVCTGACGPENLPPIENASLLLHSVSPPPHTHQSGTIPSGFVLSNASTKSASTTIYGEILIYLRDMAWYHACSIAHSLVGKVLLLGCLAYVSSHHPLKKAAQLDIRSDETPCEGWVSHCHGTDLMGLFIKMNGCTFILLESWIERCLLFSGARIFCGC